MSTSLFHNNRKGFRRLPAVLYFREAGVASCNLPGLHGIKLFRPRSVRAEANFLFQCHWWADGINNSNLDMRLMGK